VLHEGSELLLGVPRSRLGPLGLGDVDHHALPHLGSLRSLGISTDSSRNQTTRPSEAIIRYSYW
jgi:hypothetical protein